MISCPGPTAPDYRCIGDRESYCPLVEHADVVVLDPWLAGDELGVGTTADVLVDLYVGRGRTVVLLGSAGWLDPFAAGHVMRLDDRPEPHRGGRGGPFGPRGGRVRAPRRLKPYSTDPGVVVCRAR